jgi:hypothetical protein
MAGESPQAEDWQIASRLRPMLLDNDGHPVDRVPEAIAPATS